MYQKDEYRTQKIKLFLNLCHVKVAVYDLTIINCEVFVQKQNYQTYCSIIKNKFCVYGNVTVMDFLLYPNNQKCWRYQKMNRSAVLEFK